MTFRPRSSRARPAFSVPSIIAVVCAIVSFTVGPGLGFLLAILAIIFGGIGMMLAIAPQTRGGIVSIISILAGAAGIVAALLRLLF